MAIKEYELDGVYYYEIPGGMPQLKLHPFEVPLKPHTTGLDELMAWGDEQRKAGRKPCVIIPCTTFPDPLGSAWENKTDQSGILDNVPAHLDCVAVDYVNTKKPALPDIWAWNKDDPPFMFWEYAPGKVRFRGTYSRFKSTFNFDPEIDPLWQPVDPKPPVEEPGDPVIPGPEAKGCLSKLIEILKVLGG